MKAMVVGEFGGPDQLRLSEVPDPVPGPGQVRVAVRAAGVNPLPALRPGGQIAAIATPVLDLDQILDDNITFHGVLIQDDGDRTRKLSSLLSDAAIQPVISTVLPLSEAAEAHRIVESGHAGGKVVLEVPA